MLKKFTVFVLTIAVFLLLIVTVHAETGDTSSPTSETPDISRTVTVNNLEVEPMDWPIVQAVRTESFDKQTGITHTHVTIIRERPLDEYSNLSECDTIQTTYSCVPGGDKHVYDAHTLSNSNGWITSHANHWQTKYCRSGDPYCQFRKPYKLQIWWTRSNQSWRAESAVARWGCGWCNVCEGGTANYTYNDGPFTPQWSGNTSHYYTYTSSQWQKMDVHDWGSWRAGSDSNAFYGWQQIGQLSTNADG